MSADWTEEEAAIMAVVDGESAAYFRSDFEALTAYWVQSPEARWIWSGPQTGTMISVGWESVRAKFSEGMRTRPSNFDSHDFLDRRNIQICLSGDLAWVYYDQGLKQNHPNFHTQTDQKELKILHRIDGDWKLVCVSIVAPALMKDDVAQIRLSRQGNVVRMSEAAKRLLPNFQGLVVRGKRVHAAKRERDQHLQAEITSKLDGLKAGFPPSFVNKDLLAIPLGTDDYSRPLYCWVFVEGDELVITFDASQSVEERLDSAASVFKLSPTQRRLAGCLVKGLGLVDVADVLGVTINTAKTHLRRMFDKTGTHDQAGLLALLLSVDRPTRGPPRMD